MSDIVGSPPLRHDQLSLQAGPQGRDEQADEMAISALPQDSGVTARFNVISTALSARQSIAVSALALASRAQASVLYLLR